MKAARTSQADIEHGNGDTLFLMRSSSQKGHLIHSWHEMYAQLQDGPLSGGLSRRTALKCAAVLLGASAVAGMSPAPSARADAPTTPGPVRLRPGRVGFVLSHEQFTVPQLVELGVAAEQAGFDLISASDHFQPWQTNQGHSGFVWVTLGALGQRTKHIMMGTGVTCPTYRYPPAVVAQAFATLGLLYPGRIFLGVGSGEALNETAATGAWAKKPERSERLVEAVEVIRQLWTGQQVSHQGKYYRVNARLYDVPQVPVPIFMAGNGPKAIHRAGQYGDGLITDPKSWKANKGKFEAGAKAAGKNPTQMPTLVEHFVVVGDKSDAEEAAQLWRFLPKAWQPYFNIPDPRTIQERAAAEVPLEEVYKEWPVSTDPEVHAQSLFELFQAGVTEAHVHSGQHDQMRVIDFYGREVLPRVRRRLEQA
jgi:TAT-translocated FGD2 family F420-dependent dehydrogenase